MNIEMEGHMAPKFYGATTIGERGQVVIPAEARRRSRQAATDCDLMLVVGTSAVVQPAAMIPVIAKDNGAKIVEINPERTPLTDQISDYLIMGKAGEVMNRIVSDLQKII